VGFFYFRSKKIILDGQNTQTQNRKVLKLILDQAAAGNNKP